MIFGQAPVFDTILQTLQELQKEINEQADVCTSLSYEYGIFRDFLKAKFCFEPGVNTLIGENGSAKTNVFQAIRLLLDESLERNAIYLREADFCRDLDDWRGHWGVISTTFANLDASEGCQLPPRSSPHECYERGNMHLHLPAQKGSP